MALESGCDGTADETSAVQLVAAEPGVAGIDSSSGAFACIVVVAVELNWILSTRFLAGTLCSLTEPASSTLKNGLGQMEH